MFSSEVFPLNIERDLVHLKVHRDAVRGPTSLDFHVKASYKKVFFMISSFLVGLENTVLERGSHDQEVLAMLE